jgi:hypothetical protein
MNLTKGKIAKLYSKKRQSKKKYNKKRYRKNRTLRKTRGFNLAKRTLKHVKRGGVKTPPPPPPPPPLPLHSAEDMINTEHGLCLSDCRTNHPDEDSKEYKDCTDLCDENEKSQKTDLERKQKIEQENLSMVPSNLSMVPSLEEIEINEQQKLAKEMETQLQVEKDSKLAEREQTEENAAFTAEINESEEEKLAKKKKAELQVEEDRQLAEAEQTVENAASLDEISQVTEDERLAQDLQKQEKLAEEQIINGAKIATSLTKPVPTLNNPLQDEVDSTAQLPTDRSRRADESQLDVAGPRVDDDTQVPQANNIVSSVVTQLGDSAEGVQLEKQVLPSAPPLPLPLSSTPPANEDKLSQAIDTIVDHLSTKIAERINLPTGASSSGQQNGFEAVNAAALNTKGGRKPSRRLINRRRRNKSHKKKKN